MSTDFTLYALPEEAVADARRYAGTSLGYGNTSMVAVLNAAAMADASGDRFAIFGRGDVKTYRVEEHMTFHGDVPCLSHDLVDVIGHDFPEIGEALLGAVQRVKDDPKLLGFLEENHGRRLWYVFE